MRRMANEQGGAGVALGLASTRSFIGRFVWRRAYVYGPIRLSLPHRSCGLRACLYCPLNLPHHTIAAATQNMGNVLFAFKACLGSHPKSKHTELSFCGNLWLAVVAIQTDPAPSHIHPSIIAASRFLCFILLPSSKKTQTHNYNLIKGDLTSWVKFVENSITI